ncbi:UNVERIFIED_CONTAM: hypothetical protein ABID98_002864 [Brevibacillus sp. OAP136]
MTEPVFTGSVIYFFIPDLKCFFAFGVHPDLLQAWSPLARYFFPKIPSLPQTKKIFQTTTSFSPPDLIKWCRIKNILGTLIISFQ